MQRRKAIVVDIDGCLLDLRKLYAKMGSADFSDPVVWRIFHENANNPEYIKKVDGMFNLVNAFNRLNYAIVVLTSRRDFIGKGTLTTLMEGNPKLDNMSMLVMRSERQEGIPSHIYKREEIMKLAKHYDIKLVIDDEQDNITMFEQLGYQTLKIERDQLDA